MNYHDLYESLNLDGIRGFIEQGQDEHLHLDFKLLNHATLNSNDDKRNLARALSGFANSGGGLIVWGVDARKNEEGVDCARELLPIANIGLLVSRLNALTGEAVDPTVTGVRHKGTPLEDGSGFAVTMIPESDTGPHMAKLGVDQYYKRSGDSFYKMEHYDVADMFGRRRKPNLSIIYRVAGIRADASIHLGLRNNGRASAKAPFLTFRVDRPFTRSIYGLDGNGFEGLNWHKYSDTRYEWAFGGGTEYAIHPSMSYAVTCLRTTGGNEPVDNIRVFYEIACEDQPLYGGSFIIPLDYFQNVSDSWVQPHSSDAFDGT